MFRNGIVPLILARYDIKIAFYNELIQDIDGAVKSLENGYTLIMDLLLQANPEDIHFWAIGTERRGII